MIVHALLVGALIACGSSAPRTSGQAPALFAMRVDGAPFELSSIRGQVAVLHLWGAWSSHASHELPDLDALASRIADVDARVVSVALGDDRQRALNVLRSRQWRMTTLYDPTDRIGESYAPEALPAIYVIDRSGTIRSVRHSLTSDDIASIERHVRSLSEERR